MKKMFNFRFFFCLFLTMVAGHLFAVKICQSKIFLYIFFAFTIIALITAIILFFCFYKKFKNVLLYASCIVLTLVIAMGLSLIRIGIKEKDNQIPQGNYVVQGTVSYINSNKSLVYLKDVELNYGEYKLHSTVRVFVYQLDDGLEIGDSMVVSTKKMKIKYSPTLYDSFVSTINIGKNTEVSIIKSKRLDCIIRHKVKDQLLKVADKNTAEIEYAMLFGDKSYLNGELKDNYSSVGLSHLLAVSGLHVGFVIAIISKTLDKLIKNKRWFAFGIKSALIFLYLILCNFAISASRAVIMSMVLLYADARGKPYDGFSALSFAGCILLLLDPTQFYDVGFQLSFMVVFGLFGIAPLFSKMFLKVMPKWLGEGLAVSISSMICSMPIVAHYFTSVSFLSVIVNLFVIPYVSFAFTILFLFAMLALLIPPVGVILVVPSFLFDVLNYVVVSLANLSLSLTGFHVESVGLIVAVCAIIIMSKYNLIKAKQPRWILGLSLTALFILTLIFQI